MSEYVSIQEGNQNKAFNGLDKLETDLQSGDSCFWVPKSARQLESISIKANGTYHPQEKYGINRASVSVPGTSDKISGKGQDRNDYTVSLDETTGELIKTKVPSSIAVTQPPTTLKYEDGDRISFVNIEVTAYNGEGNEFDITGYPGGIVPFEELEFPVITAINNGQSGEISGGGDIQQTIPVNWPRYNDGKILTASFDITVSPKASTNTNNGDDGFTGHDGSIDDDSGGGGGHSF